MVAKEFALDLGEGAYRPDICAHVPGVALGTADTLSRRYQPGVNWSLPSLLQEVPEVIPPMFSQAFFEASEAPVNDKADSAGGAAMLDPAVQVSFQ